MNFGAARKIDLPAQRAVGRLALAFRRDGAATRVQKFYQAGCLKARLPSSVAADMLDAVTLNISGGVAGGDTLATEIALGAGARVCVASQAAERIYRALGAPARIATTVRLGAGAVLDYLPQETIFFDRFALERSLEIDLAADASYLGVESFLFGRQAMGETVKMGWLRDRITLRRDGRLEFQDMTRLEGDIAARLAGRAVASGAMAAASLIFSAPGAVATLPALRAALADANAGASALGAELIFARVLAPSAVSLRHSVVAALAACRGGRALPRVWQG
jgi:urease accessory protein